MQHMERILYDAATTSSHPPLRQPAKQTRGGGVNSCPRMAVCYIIIIIISPSSSSNNVEIRVTVTINITVTL